MVNLGKVVETAAGANLAAVTSKLASLALEQFPKLTEVSGKIKWLREELPIIQAILLDLSNEERPSEQLKLWKIKVRELAYDMEDAIDRFVLASENQHVRQVQEAQDPSFVDRIVEAITTCTNRIKKLPSDYKVVGEIDGLKARVDGSEARGKKLKLADGSTAASSSSMFSYGAIAIRDNAQFSDPDELVGIDAPSEKIIGMLKLNEGDSASWQDRKVVSIVGFGGLGKTTLAKQVFNKKSMGFACAAFVPVSGNYDVNKILRDMLVDFKSGDKLDELRQLDQRQLINKVKEHIAEKSYFVVLDDIWNKDVWTNLKGALFNNKRGSRIIVTTRKTEIAEQCTASRDSRHIYSMEPLAKADSELLFFKKTFVHEEGRCPSNLKEVCEKILKKCGGSPLAILTMSGLLASKVTASQWKGVLNYFGSAIEDEGSDVDVMRKILSLSYLDLPHHLRTCLLYLCAFPEDYEIKRKCLVNRWIAEGFIDSKHDTDKTEIGDRYFKELINRSLIQPVDLKYDGKAAACRVHDTILDFLVSKSAEENFMTILSAGASSENKIHRLSIHKAREAVTTLEKLDVSSIRSLSIFGNTDILRTFSKLTSLRVLHIEDYYVNPNFSFTEIENDYVDVRQNFQLRYLSSYVYMEGFPQGVEGLKYLETLDLRKYYGEEFPRDIYELQQLVRLFVSSETSLPDGIGKMKGLQELKIIYVSSNSSMEFIQELGLLTELRVLAVNVNELYWDNDQYSVLVSSLYKLGEHNLRSLSIEVVIAHGDTGGLMVCSDGRDSWEPALRNLWKFNMKMGYVDRVPVWLGSLSKLEKLRLGVYKMKQAELDILGKLRRLVSLSLDLENRPKERLIFKGSRGFFQSLRHLEMVCCEAMMELYFEAGSLPLLEYSYLEADLVLSGPGADYFGIEHLKSLTTIEVKLWCRGISDEQAGKAEIAIRNAVNKLPRHAVLKIQKDSYFPLPDTSDDSMEEEEQEQGHDEEEDLQVD